MRLVITRLNPLDMALLLLLFEGATLLVLGIASAFNWFSSFGWLLQDIALGLVDGVIGTVVALAFWHGLKLRVRGSGFTLTHIDVIPASLANAAFLIVLFIIEDLIGALRSVPAVGVALLGFFGVALTLLVLLLGYNLMPFKIGVVLGKRTRIEKVAVVKIAVIAGVYEAVILPLMAFQFGILTLPTVLTFTITGILAGFFGGLIGTFICNVLAPRLKPWIETQ